MFPEQIPRTNPDKLSRCRDSSPLIAPDQKGQIENTKEDVALAHEVDNALWKDAAFRATDYENIEVRVRGGIVHLYGHVSSLTNQHRAERAIQAIPGLLGVNNYLIPDDRLLAEVSKALGSLEHTYDCKFFTGVSHGVVLLSGTVGEAKVVVLAEKCAASNPNVRGVINSVRMRGSDLDLLDQPFLQPSIGEEIFFLNGISGLVKQVIINPDNRRVVAMTVRGRFADQRQELTSPNNSEARSSERVIVLSMDLVRYLTKVSGFLTISIEERNRFMDFDPASFKTPSEDWVPPYPYCSEDVLFPIEYQNVDDQIVQQLYRSPFGVSIEDQLLREQLLANDSLGG
jgi:osmotically-inducible protein OsmY